MFRTVLMTSAAFALAGQAYAQQRPVAVDAQAFGARESIHAMDLSPDGQKVVYIGPGPGPSSVVFIADLATHKAKPILPASGKPETLSWCKFASDTRLVCRLYSIVEDAGVLTPFGRTISVNTDGSDAKLLGARGSVSDIRASQSDGSVIDWRPSPTSDQTVLMTRDFVPKEEESGRRVKTKEGLGVVRLNVQTLKADIVERADADASGYMSDGLGNVRIKIVDEHDNNYRMTGRTSYAYRPAGGGSWRGLVGFQDDQFYPLAIDGAINSLYALKKLNTRWALYRIKLEDGLAEELVASNPKVDIDDVIRAGDGQKVIGYTYVDDRRHTVYFDPEYKALAASLSKALPHLPLVEFAGASDDGNKLLMFAGSDTDPGRYYVYEKTKRALGEIVLARPDLEGRTLAPVKSVQYAAADGTQVPAYLTVPAGSTGKNMPAVVLPHGGPSSRDEWGFDWLAQFLAARGYVVIQPNYRGSAGFGDAWLVDNGFKGWRTSIGDVSSAAKWLAAQGIADPARIAIVGWSYGGYAALQSAATEPQLYKAAVAVAPVTDLALLKTEAKDYTNFRLVDQFVGSGPHVAEGSPLRLAQSISVPVLLVHGDKDLNVRVSHSRKMQEALRGAGKSSDYLELPGLDHQLEDSAARRQLLTKIGELLERTIGH
jgi:dipeptidyl aminopeptidase/acylaminoacyl peptidase